MSSTSQNTSLIKSALKQFLRSDEANSALSKFLGADHQKRELLTGKEFSTGYIDFLTQTTAGITKIQSEFYNEIAFPNYDDLDDLAALIDKASAGKFAKQLDDSIPVGASVLEIGCGTGQLALYLSRFNRFIFGIDLSKRSLELATEFQENNNIQNVMFARMNIFEHKFRDGSFDVVISNGVLHHTGNPREAFSKICHLVKPGGYVVIGLYHRYGRLVTKSKQLIAPILGTKIEWFDVHLRSLKSTSKKNAWLKDQFFNPHESTHTLKQVRDWLKEEEMQFVASLPFTHQKTNNLFQPEEFPRNLIFKELSLAVSKQQILEGGFFTLVCRRPPEENDGK